MGNMSYFRFQNTAQDLADCLDHMDDDLHGEEDSARRAIVDMAIQIAESYGHLLA